MDIENRSILTRIDKNGLRDMDQSEKIKGFINQPLEVVFTCDHEAHEKLGKAS